MRHILLTSVFLFLTTTAFSQLEVKIGNQIWMKMNLNVDKFRNGDPIPQAKNDDEWLEADSLKRPAWCYMNYDSENGKIYGKCYNWYAVYDKRGLAPTGWHIPTKEEWVKLIDFTNKNFIPQDTSYYTTMEISCSDCKLADSMLYYPAGFSQIFKSKTGWLYEDEIYSEDSQAPKSPNDKWSSPNGVARDSTGFSGLPGGYCDGSGKHADFNGYWWTSTEVLKESANAWGIVLESSFLKCVNTVEEHLATYSSNFDSENGEPDITKLQLEYDSLLKNAGSPKGYGLSVRCIKD